MTFWAFRDKQGSGCGLDADGKFTINLTPGTYDLLVELGRSRKFKSFPIQKGIVIEDGEDRYMDIK